MAKAYKNFWSLNTDEAIVAGILRDAIGKKNGDVLMPLNAQMKDVDLVLMNAKNKKVITIQVKGSRAFEPGKSEVEKYGDGSKGWFFPKTNIIDNATSDYFVFLIYVIVQFPGKGRRTLEPHIITLPTKKLKELTAMYKSQHGKNYSYYFWVDPKRGVSFDYRDREYIITEYLDDKGLEILKRDLQKI
jgi:hypothetical protein